MCWNSRLSQRTGGPIKCFTASQSNYMIANQVIIWSFDADSKPMQGVDIWMWKNGFLGAVKCKPALLLYFVRANEQCNTIMCELQQYCFDSIPKRFDTSDAMVVPDAINMHLGHWFFLHFLLMWYIENLMATCTKGTCINWLECGIVQDLTFKVTKR